MRGLVLMLVLLLAGPVAAQDIQPLIGARVDGAAVLADADGDAVRVADLLSPGGTLLVLGYFRCTNLCGVLQRDLAEVLGDTRLHPPVLFASLDPAETPADARAMRAELQAAVPQADLRGWRFLTGDAGALAGLSAPLRMQTYVRPGGEVPVHPVATAVLTPKGALSEVFYGLDLDPAALDRAVAAAAEGRTGGLRDRIVLLCAGIDHALGRVGRSAMTAIRVAGAVTLLAMAAGLLLLTRRGRKEGG